MAVNRAGSGGDYSGLYSLLDPNNKSASRSSRVVSGDSGQSPSVLSGFGEDKLDPRRGAGSPLKQAVAVADNLIKACLTPGCVPPGAEFSACLDLSGIHNLCSLSSRKS